MSTRRRRRVTHLVCMILIAVLYIVSVPWYRGDDAPLRLWLGLPDWVAVALLCYVGVAVANAVAWAVTDVPDACDGSDNTDGADASEGPEAPQ